MSPEPSAFLCELDRPDAVAAVRQALTAAGIPYQTGLQAAEGARVVLFVPWRRLPDARRVVAPYLSVNEPPYTDEGADDQPERPRRPAVFPWGPVEAVSTVVLAHLGLVFWAGGQLATSPNLIRFGGIQDRTSEAPWQILTAMFVHVDPTHVLWNGVSFLVFAIPLIAAFGYRWTALIYLLAGLGGGVTAYLFLAPGSVVIGSSGAVAGLFGAWVVQAWRKASRESLSWRGKIRSLGIAALVLPSLISPVTNAGRPVSVSSHLGGLATGVMVGALISRRLVRLEPSADLAHEAAEPVVERRSPFG